VNALQPAEVLVQEEENVYEATRWFRDSFIKITTLCRLCVYERRGGGGIGSYFIPDCSRLSQTAPEEEVKPRFDSISISLHSHSVPASSPRRRAPPAA